MSRVCRKESGRWEGPKNISNTTKDTIATVYFILNDKNMAEYKKYSRWYACLLYVLLPLLLIVLR